MPEALSPRATSAGQSQHASISAPPNAPPLSPHNTEKKPFWKIHVPRLPGSIRAIGGDEGGDTNTAKVIGAQYTFGAALTPQKHASSNSTASITSTGKSTAGALSNSASSQNKAKQSSQSFDQFINATDADWGADDDDTGGKKVLPSNSQHFSAGSGSHSASPIRLSASSPYKLSKMESAADTDKQAASDLLALNARVTRFDKFTAVLNSANVDLATLRKLSWSGIPDELRSTCWQLLMGYLPCNAERRAATLARKRKEYEDNVAKAYGRGDAGLDQEVWHQIHIDVPRTNPSIPLYQKKCVQQSLERVLYCWAMKHPASGYVQGINDLVTPFFTVFLSQYCGEDVRTGTKDVYTFDVAQLPAETLTIVEADSFWCLTKLLDNIQDNYTSAQPGIQRQISTLKDLISRIDAALYAHLEKEGVEFIHFSFRWMNCLLIRELTPKSVVRMWDTYMAEGSDGFSDFHMYVCAAYLAKWSQHLRTLDFQNILMFLQNAPTQAWGEKEIELLLSEAFMWKSLFHNSPSHLHTNT